MVFLNMTFYSDEITSFILSLFRNLAHEVPSHHNKEDQICNVNNLVLM